MSGTVPQALVRCCRVCGTQVRSRGLDTCWAHLAEGLGLTYRQLDHWSRRGYLRPERKPSRRGSVTSGSSRRWSEGEIEVAARMKRLVDAGLTPEAAHRFARETWPEGEIGPGLRVSIDMETEGL